jgi:hypothetical protein
MYKYSVETMSNYIYTQRTSKMNTISTKMLNMLERLAEMFPQQQSRLEMYINSKNPSNAAEVDYWQRQYESEAKHWGRGL